MKPEELFRAYSKGELCGWAEVRNPGLARHEFQLLTRRGSLLPRLVITNRSRNYRGGKVMLHQFTRKVLGGDTKNYGQEIGDPFVAGTMVAMADGSERPIEMLKVGDLVVNHKNRPARVSRVIKKQFTGRLVTVRLKGWHRKLTATETHHGMLIPESGRKFQHERPARVKFGDMKVGDFMMTPFGMEAEREVTLDLADYVDGAVIGPDSLHRRGRSIRRFVKVDEKFGRLMGLYMAEGGCGANVVTFSYNAGEKDLIAETISLVSDVFGLPARTQKTGNENCTRVAVQSRLLMDFVKKIVPGNVYSKRVPGFFFRSGRGVRKSLLRGWYDGDGHKNFERNAVIGYTASPGLGDDMLRVASSCGLNARSWTRLREKRATVPTTEVAIYGSEVGKVYDDRPSRCRVRPSRRSRNEYGMVRPIAGIDYEDVVDRTVYCITTEDEYTAVFNGVAQYQCVSFGAKNATEYLTCTEIALGGERQKFRSVFPPYYYGTGRVYVGGGRLGNSDGSLGSWMAEAVQKYGTLFSDEPDVPSYSGRVAKAWGDPNPRSDLDVFKPKASEYLVKSAALVRTWDELVAAISNGYPCTTASNVGYAMEPSSDGFHRQRGSWAHQMCIIGVDDNERDPYAIILNSWGDAHGRLKDFDTREDLPIGVLRVRRADVEKHLRARETFAFSQFQGFPEQPLDKELFDLV